MKIYLTNKSIESELVFRECLPDELQEARLKLRSISVRNWKIFVFNFMALTLFVFVVPAVLPTAKWLSSIAGAVLFGIVASQWYYYRLFAELRDLKEKRSDNNALDSTRKARFLNKKRLNI